MTKFAAAGSRLYIGSAPIDDKDTDFVDADFSSVTWEEVSPLETIGSVGDNASEITFDELGRQRTTVLKGPRRAPTLEISAALNYQNAGQTRLLEAEKTNVNYPLRIVFNDAPATGSAPTPSERKMIGLIMSVNETVQDANSVLMLTASIAVNSNLVRTNAATGD